MLLMSLGAGGAAALGIVVAMKVGCLIVEVVEDVAVRLNVGRRLVWWGNGYDGEEAAGDAVPSKGEGGGLAVAAEGVDASSLSSGATLV